MGLGVLRRRLTPLSAVLMVALVVSLGVAIVAFASGGGTQVCIPNASGKPIVTPKGGVCKSGYTLKELGAEGKEGPPGKEGKAGPPGQARAYATITPGSPATIQAGARGVVGAETYNGITCVYLDPSINLAEVTVVATSVLFDVTFATDPNGCAKAGPGVQVNGYNPNGTGNTSAKFSIVVP
jgi:hypothetical protein